MTRRAAIALVVALATVVPSFAQDDDPRARAAQLVREAQALADDGRRDQAMARLLQALELAPDYPSIYAHMGYLHELEGNTTKALASYGQLLELQPGDEYARARITHLFLGGKFPRRLRTSLLRFSPVSFVTDECRIEAPVGVDELRRGIAYTSDVIYPEEMKRGDGPLEKDIPSAGGQGVVGTALFNRVCYGFIAVPEGDELLMTSQLLYPSPLLSEHGSDYGPLAKRLMHILLRLRCYSRTCFGLPQAVDDPIVRLWLCEVGPTGAEQYEDDIFIYDANRERTPLEWMREVAHEWGHYSLPPMGRFTAPEPYASGLLGEALYLQLLAQEAGLVAGERWPAEAAIAAVNGLWGTGEVQLADYLAETRQATMDLWLREGPNSEMAAGLGEESFRYLVGAMLWVEAAHGHGMLRSTLLKAPGESPADFYYGYREAIREAAEGGPITMDAGALNLPASELSQPPVEGALRREQVTLAAGDRASWPVYLLDGPASVRVEPGLREVELELYVDDVGPLPIRGGEAVSLGVRQQGWHSITLVAPQGCQPIELRSLVIDTGEPAQPAPQL